MVEENGSLCECQSSILLTNIKLQNSLLNEWLMEDSHLKNSYLLIQSFRRSDSSGNIWQSKNFLEEGDYDFHCYFQGSWVNSTEECKEEGLNLSGKAITYPIKLQLRALAVEIKIRLKLTFHSSFYIITRVQNELLTSTPVIKILKDANLRGIFLVFGSIHPVTHKFSFIKQNQIPEISGNSDEYRELEIEVIDNGDDKIFVSVSSFGKVQTVRPVSFCCPGFVPMLKESQVYFAAYGDGTVIKSLSMQYKERICQKSKPKRSPECACTVV